MEWVNKPSFCRGRVKNRLLAAYTKTPTTATIRITMADTHLHTDCAISLPLLITGIAGVAGYNALAYFQDRYPGQVIGIRQADNWPLTGPGIEACNAEDRDALVELFDKYQFRSVLNCAGNCALKACELDSRLAWRTNVEGMITLLSICCDREVRLVHTSIDLVYAGRDLMPLNWPGYTESDPTDPVTVYGTTMVAAEQLILDSMPSACTLRISLPMGISFNGHAGAIDWIQSRFAKNRPATLYFDEVRTPTYTDCLNGVYESLLANDVAGLFHAGGPRRLSLYQIAQVINRVGGYDPALLHGCPRIEAGPIPPRAGNVTMDSSQLATALGYEPFDPWPLDEEMVPTDDLWHFERTGFQGSPELLAEVLYRNPRRVNGAA
ncbi:dTDP-4-dehydrorhamnose reductase [Bythopirellula goksoeyrii]|uniref:dTDP-4-dehydrorhamnose reductase n=2 Tax=Bythopirellula goksoeyrii TaxID=1400387 RepID=A0A5B9QC97_9BACT|nr:dTDP-4-dehydrorhamnose reductase [Bythopirellula goksoeyrii]